MIWHILIMLVISTTFIIGVISIEASMIIQAFPKKQIDKDIVYNILQQSALSFIHLDFEGFNNKEIRKYFSGSFPSKGVFLILIPYLMTALIILSVHNIYYRLFYMVFFILGNYVFYRTIKIYFFIRNTYS